ncbi:MAG: Zn-dependent exopeptidase M28 [Oscillospiraceae bacterium]|nr:Zn-dependent exopeptidase M28 [Oscillospiraceae bacterium]
MIQREIQKIIKDAGHIRVSASKEEKWTAEYLAEKARALGAEARVEPFEVAVTKINDAHLYADGKEVACKAYECCGSGSIEAPLCYIADFDPISLSKVKGKIVLFDGLVSTFNYHDMLDAGALGFITYDGDVKWRDNDIDLRELREYMAKGRKVLGVNINAKDAVKLVKNLPVVKIVIDQDESTGHSWNTIAEIPGTTDEWITMSCHLDSRPLAPGVWDNLTGCITLLNTLEMAAKSAPHRYGIRAVFCGSEERGLLGSKAYVKMHEAELDKIALNVNVDMIGSIMGEVVCFVNATDPAIAYLKAFSCEKAFPIKTMPMVMASDSSSFADKGIPSYSFGKLAPQSCAVIHSRYDNASIVSDKQIQEDANFISEFTLRIADAAICPVERKLSDAIKKQLDEYFYRKRKDH